jgi:hypothetical protein
MGETRNAYRGLVGKPEGKIALGRPRCRGEDNIKMCNQDVGWGMEWIDLAQDRGSWRALVIAATNLRVPQNAGNFLTSRRPVSFSIRPLLHAVSQVSFTVILLLIEAQGFVRPS